MTTKITKIGVTNDKISGRGVIDVNELIHLIIKALNNKEQLQFQS